MTAEHEIRAALRIVAFHGRPSLGREAQKRMAGDGDPVMAARILRRSADDPAGRWPSLQDHLQVLRGAVAANPDDRGLLQVAHHEAGISLRDLAGIVGISHTAIRKRLQP